MDERGVLAPFMGDFIPLKVGLNQLGMRTIGEQLFSMLLPGLNNVTEPLRSYSFYCWVINHLFDNVDLQKIKKSEYQTYIRTSEYLLALVCYDQIGVPGVTLARKFRERGLEKYNLEDGTEGVDGKDKYFKNPGGAFIQYFASSMANLGLIHSIPDKNGKFTLIYNTTGRGRELGKEFGNAVGEDVEKKFFYAIKTGIVYDAVLNEIRLKIDMHCPSTETKEHDLFIDLIIGKDFPETDEETYYRRETLKLLLTWLDTEPEMTKDLDFVNYLLELFFTKEEKSDTLWGWFAYGINEDWQFQSTIIFRNLLIQYLAPNGAKWHNVDDIVNI